MIAQTFGEAAVSTASTLARPNLWSYASTDAIATVCAANYISNAGDLGLNIGDMVFVVDTSSTLGSFAYCSALSSGAATLLSSFVTT
jgi:hypothetical protein